MAEAVILLAVKKIGVALGNEALNQASSRFKKFITQLTELQGSMSRIRREFRLMHEFLCCMDVRNRKNQAYEIWVQELRMLAHGIEDIVDEYLYLVGPKHDTGWSTYLKKGFKRPNVLLSLNRVASLVKEAEVNLVHLFQAKDRWVSMIDGGNNSSSSYIVERSQHLASMSLSLGEEDLVGADGNRNQLEQWLAGDDLELSVIALDGMGGLGKTALAANIYRKEREKFECHAWVSISQTYSIKDVLKCLITECYKEGKARPDNIDDMDTRGLRDELKTFLENMKYLIVLDDVWAPEAVNDLFGALAQNQKGSRVLVTTRIDAAAHLALAIVTVGRLLFVRDKTIEEFKRICDQLDWEIVNHPSMEHVRNILYLSFIYLPTYLKSCFLYCSLFPEDYLFHRKKLLRLWVAEGFIEERGESTLEDVAALSK